MRWLLLLREFDIEVVDRRDTCNQVADHLSRLENADYQEPQTSEIQDAFPDESLFRVDNTSTRVQWPWYADLANFVVSSILPEDHNYNQRK